MRICSRRKPLHPSGIRMPAMRASRPSRRTCRAQHPRGRAGPSRPSGVRRNRRLPAAGEVTALLTGKTAVVTGGGSGRGLTTARRFIDEGATVFITGRRAAEPETAVSDLGSAAVAVRGDVAVPADLQRLHGAAASTGRGIDIIFPTLQSPALRRSGRLPKRNQLQGVVLTVQTLLPLLNDGHRSP